MKSRANGFPRTVPDATWQQHLGRPRQPGGGNWEGGWMKVEGRTTGVYFGQQEREVLTKRQFAGVDGQAQRHSSSGTRRKNREGMRRGCEGRDRPPLLQSASSPAPVLPSPLVTGLGQPRPRLRLRLSPARGRALEFSHTLSEAATPVPKSGLRNAYEAISKHVSCNPSLDPTE